MVSELALRKPPMSGTAAIAEAATLLLMMVANNLFRPTCAMILSATVSPRYFSKSMRANRAVCWAALTSLSFCPNWI